VEPLLAVLVMAVAGNFIVPPPASDLRRSVLGALRPPIEKRLGSNVKFKITLIRVQRDWAFVVADPQRKGGQPINGYKIFGEDFENMDGLRIDAVLRKQGDRWIVVDHAIGATDVWYCDIGPRELKAGWGC
jgi:hypothetical protein